MTEWREVAEVQDPALVSSLVLAFALASAVLWVLRDARAHARQGRPVGVYVGNVGLESPEAWAVACLAGFVLFFPLYLRARVES